MGLSMAAMATPPVSSAGKKTENLFST